jgi:hypothetical protein
MNPANFCRRGTIALSCTRTFNPPRVNRQLAGLSDELIYELVDLAEVREDLAQAVQGRLRRARNAAVTRC